MTLTRRHSQAVLRHAEAAVANNTGHDQVSIAARMWIDYCRANHPDCTERDAHDTYRPSRLIDLCPPGLPEDQFWRLIDDTSGLSGGYATLSHRWGRGKLEPFKLTRDTHHDMLNGLPLTCLSGTYRDAMRVVRRLGLRYMWIDSLCVSQDPETLDIQVAAYRMADIYGHSSCNIATLSARQDTMFSQRDPRLVSPAATMLSASQYGLRSSYAVLLAKQWERSILETPLSRRAWILQEQLLPRRMLYFGEQQILWSCSEGSFCELYPLDDITYSWLEEGMFEGDLGSLRGSLSDVIAAASLQSSSAAKTVSRSLLAVLWWDLLNLYGQRHLTYAEDKLLAIAGLGQLLRSAGDGETTIIGGLMTNELPENLLWIPDHSTSRLRGYEPVRLSLVHRAPSWSWAYYDGPISYGMGDGAAAYHLGRPVAKVVEIETDVTVMDDLKIVKGGDLHLFAAALPLELESSHLDGSTSARKKIWRMPFASSLPTPTPYTGTDLALKLTCGTSDTAASPSPSSDHDRDDLPPGLDGEILFDLIEYLDLSEPLVAVFITISVASPRRHETNPNKIYRFEGLVLRRHPSRGSCEVTGRNEIYERVGTFVLAVSCSNQPDVPMTRLWHFDNYEVRKGGTGPRFTPYDFEAAKDFMRRFIIA